MKKNSKKSTNKKLVNTVAKREAKPKKLGSKVVKGKKSAKINKIVTAKRNRNSFRRALYRANKIIASGSSLYPKGKKLSMKEFKKEYEKFGKRTGMLKGKKLDEKLKIFIGNAINSKTPKQCESAVDNLMKHLNDAVNALNRLEGDINFKGNIDGLSNTDNKYIQVLIKARALKIDQKDGKKFYAIIKENLPDSTDLIQVNNKYLSTKRIIIQYFGDEEYAEAYGS